MLFKSKKVIFGWLFCVNTALVAVVDLAKNHFIFVDKGWEVSKNPSNPCHYITFLTIP